MAGTTGNRLADAVSPYLLQHKDNPVHWHEWTDETLAEAKAQDRPILLSVGYAACHWCHVMAHESFEDEDTAAVMNRLFVNVKVDREERPDVDHLYMTALQALGEQGGWPMTMFLTPEGQPFFGGTYFPKSSHFGRPAFVQVLEAIGQAWRTRREEINRSAGEISRHLAAALSRSGAAEASGNLELFSVREAADRIARMCDLALGGFNGAPKFPNAPHMELLARSFFETGAEAHRAPFFQTTDALSLGGIYDHVGGGLHRYSTDASWLVPHFEKMLYDNAQFLRHLTWAARSSGDALHRRRIAETIGWLEREMLVEDGGFAASLDADSPGADGHGEEGAFYVWTEDEIDRLLGENARAFKNAYDVTPGGNWEGKTILHRLHLRAGDPDASFDSERAALLDARAERARPGRDDKVLADWNAMTIRALAEIAAARFDERALPLAQNAFAFVLDRLTVDGRLRHAYRDGRTAGLALSTDYGTLIQAAVSLWTVTLEPRHLAEASRLADELDLWHGDGEGGHMLTAVDASDVPVRLRGDHDEAVPSGTAQVLDGLSMLAQASGEPSDLERAERAAALAMGRAGDMALNYPGIVAALGRLRRGSELALFGFRFNPGFEACRSVIDRHVDLDRLDIVTSDPEALPEDHPLTAAKPERFPSAYLCRNRACQAPVHEASDLEALLDPARTASRSV